MEVVAISGSVVSLDSGAVVDGAARSLPSKVGWSSCAVDIMGDEWSSGLAPVYVVPAGVASSVACGAPPLLSRAEVSSSRWLWLSWCVAVSGSVVVLDSGAVLDRPCTSVP